VQAIHELHQVKRRDFADFLLRQSFQELLVGSLNQAVNGLQILALGDGEFLIEGREKLRFLHPPCECRGMNPDLLGNGLFGKFPFSQ